MGDRVNTYQQNIAPIVQAIKLENNRLSVNACINFITKNTTQKELSLSGEGLKIIFEDTMDKWAVVAEFGNYIVKDESGIFHVLCDDVFESRYTRIN